MDKVQYWVDLCDYDFKVAKSMLESKHYLYVGFMCHQVVEKGFKAIIAELGEIPPKIHDLQKLATQGQVFDKLSEEQFVLLDILKPLNIEARYPEMKGKISQTLSFERCVELIKETEDLLCWIKQQLGK